MSRCKGDHFKEKELSRKCIAPNIPVAWTKDFRLKEGHEEKKINHVVKILKILEHSEERDEKRRERNSSKSNKGSKDIKKGNKSNKDKGKGEKPKNPCKLPNHSNHNWADCYNSPKPKKFKGTAKNWKDTPKKDKK